jgi:hypothetical protein
MDLTSELLKVGRTQDIWQKHCGFINLTLDQFMEIQDRLLAEQIELLYESVIGKEILRNSKPRDVNEFRSMVPITTYEDYAHYLDEKNEDVLPVRPFTWASTSGRASGKGNKWVPYTKKMYDLLGDGVIGAMIMSSCTGKGDVNLQLSDKLLFSLAPPPYVTSLLAHSTRDQLGVKFLPSLEDGEYMDFGERVATGFSLAMREGLDYFYGLASILTRIGEQFEQSSGGTSPSRRMLNPLVLWRLIRAVIKTRIQKRTLLPKDIWSLKGIVAGGTDTPIYKDKIEYYWGKKPLEGYGCTEVGAIACQAWNFKGISFTPDRVFLEFMPYEEHIKLEEDPTYFPKTKLFNELDKGIYELVVTNFHGGVFTRYRIKDLFEVVSIGDDEIDSELPQFQLYSRTADLIDLSSMVRLTERDIWSAIENTGIPYQDFVARKEYANHKANIHLYVEPKPGKPISVEEARHKISQYLKENLQEYRDSEEILGIDPLVLSFLPVGAFRSYVKAQQEAGADLDHIKPPHMNPNDSILERLLHPEQRDPI